MRVHPAALFITLVVLSLNANGQQKGSLNEQVTVIRSYKPVLGEVYKIKKSPSFQDNAGSKFKPDYTFKDLRLVKDSAHSSITPDTVATKDSTQFPGVYIKAAGGNLQTILGEVYLSSHPNTTAAYGAWFRHLSERGKYTDQAFSKEDLALHAKKVLGGSYLAGSITGAEHLVHFYGYDHSTGTLNLFSNTRQNLKTVEAELEFASTPDSTAGFLYSVKIKGHNFSDSYSNRENHYQASGHIGYTVLNMLTFNLASQILFNKQVQQTGVSYNNSIFRIQPSISLGTKLVRVKAGLNLVSDIGDNHRIQVLPDLAADLYLDYGFNLFGGIKGDVIQNTFKGYAEENPWLKGTLFYPPVAGPVAQDYYQSYALYNTRQNFYFYAGIKGAFSKEFNYRAQVEAGTYDNLPFFENNPADSKLFLVVYDGKGTTREKFNAELNYLPSDRLRLSANLNYVIFKLKNLPEPWHVPTWEGDFDLHYRITQKLELDAGFNYTGKRFAFTQIADSQTIGKITLAAYTDVHLGAEYRLSKKFSIFALGSNLLNTRYQIFLNYPVLGINVRAGLTWSF